MSKIVGPDGKKPIKPDAPKLRYKAGGLMFDTPIKPDDLLNEALSRTRLMVGQDAYKSAIQKTGSAVVANTEAQTAAAGVVDPFAMEPCAMAIFMYLSREIEYRDKIIDQINKKLQELGQEPLDLSHPYPLPAQKTSEDNDGNISDEEKRLEGIADESRAACLDLDE